MDITGPEQTEQGYVFTMKMKVTACDDAPVEIWDWSPHVDEALKWAKANLEGLFYPTPDGSYYLGIPSLEEAVFFKLMWM